MPQKAGRIGVGETENKRERPFAATADAGDLYLASPEDNEGLLGKGATADVARSSWLAIRNRRLESRGVPGETTYP